MKTTTSIGIALISGALGVFIPYTLLTISFDYPGILREDTGTILTKFHDGGAALILTWWAFGLLGLPLLVAYVQIGQWLEKKATFVRWATAMGVISGVVQIIGLLRWVFVVPVLAQRYLEASNPAEKYAIEVTFQVVHQLGGVLLGEHLGQLFTCIWTVMISTAFLRLLLFPRWVHWFGIGSACIYLLAQTELAATVIPGFPVLNWAGFLGSTLWLVWLLVLGGMFVRNTN